MPVGGRSLIRRTLEAFDRCPEITGITLMVSQSNLLEVARELESDGWRKAIDIRLGGERRQDSVRLGLQSLSAEPPDFVIVHDGARPLVTDDLIHAGLKTARQHGAATAAVPVRHTYKHVDSSGFVHGTVERADLMQVQTPQVFRYDWILEAHERAVRERIEVEYDAELIEKIGKPVKVFSGSYSNLKVVTREDALMVEALLAADPLCV
jgi:2-C-methyl-D-erythritol 4-phosphate cytidylyltransferase